MDWQAIQIGVMELGVAAVVGLAVVYGSYRLFARLTPGFDEEEEIARDNRAAAIALGGSLIGVALIVREAIYPITATVQDLAEAPWSFAAAGKAVGYAGLYLAITAIAALFTVVVTMRLFTALTRDLDERGEIARGNVAAATLYAAVVIAIAVFVAEGAGSLTKALIPHPPLYQEGVATVPAPLPHADDDRAAQP